MQVHPPVPVHQGDANGQVVAAVHDHLADAGRATKGWRHPVDQACCRRSQGGPEAEKGAREPQTKRGHVAIQAGGPHRTHTWPRVRHSTLCLCGCGCRPVAVPRTLSPRRRLRRRSDVATTLCPCHTLLLPRPALAPPCSCPALPLPHPALALPRPTVPRCHTHRRCQTWQLADICRQEHLRHQRDVAAYKTGARGGTLQGRRGDCPELRGG